MVCVLKQSVIMGMWTRWKFGSWVSAQHWDAVVETPLIPGFDPGFLMSPQFSFWKRMRVLLSFPIRERNVSLGQFGGVLG